MQSYHALHFAGIITLIESFELPPVLDKLIRVIPFLIKTIKEQNYRK